MTFNRNCLGAQCWNGVDLALKNVKSTLFQWAQRVEIPSTQRHDSKSWRWTNVESTIVDSSSRRNNVESYLLSLFINILVCSSSMYKGYVKTTRLQSEHTWDIYCTCTNFFFFFFFDLGFMALSRIFHLYRADRSSKVAKTGEPGEKPPDHP